MIAAIAKAKEAVSLGSSPFGCVIVNTTSSEIVATGKNHAEENPLWHGEMDAINELAESYAQKGLPFSGNDLELYTTAEPCSMCMSAIEWAFIKCVVYGSSIGFLQKSGWRQIDIKSNEVEMKSDWINVTIIGGVLQTQTNKLYEAGPSLLVDHDCHDHGH